MVSSTDDFGHFTMFGFCPKRKRETGHMYQIMIRTHTQNAHRSQCLFGPFQAAADTWQSDMAESVEEGQLHQKL